MPEPPRWFWRVFAFLASGLLTYEICAIFMGLPTLTQLFHQLADIYPPALTLGTVFFCALTGYLVVTYVPGGRRLAIVIALALAFIWGHLAWWQTRKEAGEPKKPDEEPGSGSKPLDD